MRKLFFILILIGLKSFAQESTDRKASHWNFNSELVLWNESISVAQGDEVSEYLGQFPGASLGFEYRRSMDTRWYQAHSINFMGGMGHITGASGGVSDDLRGQMWFGGSLSLGFLYRTTETSDFRFGVPVFYRVIQFKDAREELEFTNQAQMAYGFEFSSAIRMSPTSSLIVGWMAMKDFPSSIWKVGLSFRM